MPFLEMIVNQYCKESQEDYVLHLIKLFYYKTNISSVDVLHGILGNGIFLTSLKHICYPTSISRR